MNYHNKQRGFIALMSTIVISMTLIALMATVGLSSFYARFDALGADNKRQAHALAEACVEAALLALATSTDAAHYMPTGQTVDIGTDAGNQMACVIRDVVHNHNGSSAVIDTYASSGDSFDSVSAEVSLIPNIQIISWGESP